MIKFTNLLQKGSAAGNISSDLQSFGNQSVMSVSVLELGSRQE